MKRNGLPLDSLVSLFSSTKELKEVKLVLGPYYRDSCTHGSRCGVKLPKKVRVFKNRWLMSPGRKYVLPSWGGIFMSTPWELGRLRATMEVMGGE